eukprot:TRINITY_DN8494_c0_g1_i1.p2 TRINITY_DN8494_c0_g1~~TRINITY_DN8494_c0_g1_i1.p2  ORF type:complete len:119 (-),score=32.28 TRINITY_DN8494_c0_g1_i1:40-396(-)
MSEKHNHFHFHLPHIHHHDKDSSNQRHSHNDTPGTSAPVTSENKLEIQQPTAQTQQPTPQQEYEQGTQNSDQTDWFGRSFDPDSGHTKRTFLVGSHEETFHHSQSEDVEEQPTDYVSK